MAFALQIAPSIVSAPLLDLASVLQELRAAHIEKLHIDIEDGHFVPVMNLGTRFIEDLRTSGFFLDVHLMVDNPEQIVPLVIEMGAQAVTFHFEATRYPRRELQTIRQAGLQAGLAFNAKTPLPDLDYLADLVDIVNILTTEPEGPTCPFLPSVLGKARQAAEWARGMDHPINIVVDGGIGPDNIAEVVKTGADTVVVGRALFRPPGVTENITHLREKAIQ